MFKKRDKPDKLSMEASLLTFKNKNKQMNKPRQFISMAKLR